MTHPQARLGQIASDVHKLVMSGDCGGSVKTFFEDKADAARFLGYLDAILDMVDG